jgi:hypothetical protein
MVRAGINLDATHSDNNPGAARSNFEHFLNFQPHGTTRNAHR